MEIASINQQYAKQVANATRTIKTREQDMIFTHYDGWLPEKEEETPLGEWKKSWVEPGFVTDNEPSASRRSSSGRRRQNWWCWQMQQRHNCEAVQRNFWKRRRRQVASEACPGRQEQRSVRRDQLASYSSEDRGGGAVSACQPRRRATSTAASMTLASIGRWSRIRLSRRVSRVRAQWREPAEPCFDQKM